MALSEAAARAVEAVRGPAIAHARRVRSARARHGAGAAIASASDRAEVEVTAFCDGREGRATGGSLDADAIADTARAARGAAEAAARAAGPGAHPGPAAPEPARAHEGWDEETAVLGAEALLRRLAESNAAGTLVAEARWEAVASSTGLEGPDRRTQVEAELESPGGGWARGGAVAVGRLALEELVAAAAARAASDAEPAAGPAGAVPAVLGPEAVGALLEALAACALDGLAHAEGRGALSGRLGTRVAAACVSLADSPRFAGTLPAARDAEGVPKAPLPLLQDGVAHRVVHDLRSAAVAGGGARSTGHATGRDGPRPANLVLVGGGAADEPELAARVADGVYASRVRGLRVLDPAASRISAVLDGVRELRDGRPGAVLAPLRLAGTALEAFAAAEALTARPRLVGAGRRGVICPAVRFAALDLRGPA